MQTTVRRTRVPRTTKHYICDLDEKVNGDQDVSLPTALRRIEKYIIENIDPTFSTKAFRAWLNSDTEKPFRSSKNRFYWKHES